ncbi:cytochrome c [Neobacillus cucumis]|uniref:cytochrome c550 n=1 Tax=Neobacillus cucumis TaxID=1740721 RepID=UPI0018DFFC85|nr:cytochrome c [Neobacillus cucumis]MBI0576376.1 cytochrome c [Neobacillus cucumis]WHY90549.1 cytochrome c [Neobacillus cucumis]
MKRNPVIPYILIFVFGIGLTFLLSFKGLGDMKEVAKDKNGGGGAEKTETVATKPEDIYKQTCIGCHGDQYQGVVGPSLKGIGSKLSKDEIIHIITKGKGNMPPNLVPQEQAEAMAEWVSKIK